MFLTRSLIVSCGFLYSLGSYHFPLSQDWSKFRIEKLAPFGIMNWNVNWIGLIQQEVEFEFCCKYRFHPQKLYVPPPWFTKVNYYIGYNEIISYRVFFFQLCQPNIQHGISQMAIQWHWMITIGYLVLPGTINKKINNMVMPFYVLCRPTVSVLILKCLYLQYKVIHKLQRSSSLETELLHRWALAVCFYWL